MAHIANKFEAAFDFGKKFLENHVSKNIDYQKWLALLGLSYFAWEGLSAFTFLYKNFIRPRRDLLTRYGEGSWVLVVGASGGLGRAFCEAFADAGFNIILLGRNRAKLELVAQFVRSRNGKTETRIILSDLTEAVNGAEFVNNVVTQLEDLDVAILVNCAGVPDNDFFHNRDDKSLINSVAVNCIAPVFITKKMTQRFLTRGTRSAIINVSSQAGLRPTPYTIPYSCSSTFLNYFTLAVQKEIGHKVDVVSCVPYLLKTKMMFNQTYSSDSLLPEKCVKSVLDQLGYENRTAGHWKHQLIESALDSIPEKSLNRLYQETGPRYIMWRKEQARDSSNQLPV